MFEADFAMAIIYRFRPASYIAAMSHDPTVILEQGYLEKSKKGTSSEERELSGVLKAAERHFIWHARRVGRSWFVTIQNSELGSRGKVTRDDPADVALELAKKIALPTAGRTSAK